MLNAVPRLIAMPRTHLARSRKARSRTSRRRVALFEQLEERALLATATEIATLVNASAFANAGEIRLNTETQHTQLNAAIATAADGSFVAAWTSYKQDGSGYAIVAQRFNADGTRIGSEFIVNNLTRRDQVNPAIAVNDSGQFAIAWQTMGHDGNGWGIAVRLFNANGTPQGTEFIANQTTKGGQVDPAIEFLSDGGLVVTWHGRGNGDRDGVFGRVFSATGAAQTNEFLVNQTTRNLQRHADVVALSNGGFAIAWNGRGNGDRDGIYMRLFNSNAQPTGNEILVNTRTRHIQSWPSIAQLPTGGFVVTWQGWRHDGRGWGVFAQVLNDSGNRVGEELLVNQTTKGHQSRPSVAALDDGGFLVSWQGRGNGDRYGTFARVFSSARQPLTPETLVNSTTSGSQTRSHAVATSNGVIVAWDGRGLGDSRGVFSKVIRTAAGVAPVIQPIADQAIPEEAEWVFQVVATDADSPVSSLTFSFDGTPPSGATINAQTGEIRWTPTEAQGPGTFNVTVRVVDPTSLSDTESFTVTVNEVNRAPVLAAIADRTVVVGNTLTFVATATDPDLPANTLAFQLTGTIPSGATINSTTGAFSWTPAATDAGMTFPITITVSDNGSPSLSDSRTFNVTVSSTNQPPLIAPIVNQTIPEEVEFVLQVVATDEDSPASSLRYSLVGIVPDGAMIDAITGEFRWTPSETQGPGTFTVMVRVTDDTELIDTATFMITVLEVNRAPVLDDVQDQTASVDTELTVTVTATDPDLPSNVLTFSLDGEFPNGATIDPATGVFTWTPEASDAGMTFSITVVVTDDGTPELTDATTFSITVMPDEPVAPQIQEIADQTIPEEQPFSLQVVVIDPDTPPTALTYLLLGEPPDGLTIDAETGLITWTPSEEQGPGTYVIVVQVVDETDLSDTATFTIDVVEVNRPPELAEIPDRLVIVGTELSFIVMATDADSPANELTFELSGEVPEGATFDPETGLFSWTPAESDLGMTFALVVTVTDDGSPILSDSKSFQLTVVATGAPVLEQPLDVNTLLDTPVVVELQAMDPDSAPEDLVFSAESVPAAQLVIQGNRLTITPPEEYVGILAISVTVMDEMGLSDIKTFIVRVQNCAFDTDVRGWAVTETGGTPSLHGSAIPASCEVTLFEGDSSTVVLSTSFTISEGANGVSFVYRDLIFDETDEEGNDTFEALLLDAAGNPIGMPIMGSDAFFRVVEGMPFETGSKVIVDEEVVNGVTHTRVTLEFDQEIPSQTLMLTLRLRNPDSDMFTTITIVDYDLPGFTRQATGSSGAKFLVADPQAESVFQYSSAGESSAAFLSSIAHRNPRGITSNAAGDRVWTIDGTSSNVTVFAGDGRRLGSWLADGLVMPEGITMFDNDLWVVDDDTDRVYLYEGAASRVRGTLGSTSSFALDLANTSPMGLATDGSRMWVVDDALAAVFVYTLDGDLLGIWELDALNNDPSGITNDPSGGTNLWVVDRSGLVFLYADAAGVLQGSLAADDTFDLDERNAAPEGIADPISATMEHSRYRQHTSHNDRHGDLDFAQPSAQIRRITQVDAWYSTLSADECEGLHKTSGPSIENGPTSDLVNEHGAYAINGDQTSNERTVNRTRSVRGTESSSPLRSLGGIEELRSFTR